MLARILLCQRSLQRLQNIWMLIIDKLCIAAILEKWRKKSIEHPSKCKLESYLLIVRQLLNIFRINLAPFYKCLRKIDC